MKSLLIVFLVITNLFCSIAAYAAQRAPEKTYFESASITTHTLKLNGKTLTYNAAAGYLPIKNNENKTIAQIFYISYIKESENLAERPLTFAFNGGPGSSSIWLHMGALGPKRVVIPDDGTAITRSYDMVDNQSWNFSFRYPKGAFQEL